MWFSASLLFQSVHRIPSDGSLWEESIRLIKATSLTEAKSIADLLRRSSETEYSVSDIDSVRWTFVRVESVFSIEDDLLKSGIELFSRFLRESEVNSLLTPFDDF